MIIMSVDLGLARTGIALCDALQTLAFPKTVIHEHNTTRLVDKISQLAKEYGAKRIIVGLSADNEAAKHLYEKHGFTVFEEDEEELLMEKEC